MAKFNPSLNSFGAGELTKRLEGRDDIAQYHQGMRRCTNFMPQPQGGVARRPGTRYTATVKVSANDCRLMSFIVSPSLAYIIEAGDLYFRYYTNEGQLISGTPVEDATPYLDEELDDVQTAQSANVMYLVHPAHWTARLRRITAANFTFEELPWEGGKLPMYPANVGATTITVSGGGPYTLTASSALFDDTGGTDVGRVFRIKETTEGWLEITSVSSPTVATASLVGGAAPGGSATADWSRGAQSDIEGFRAIGLHENRLVLAGAIDEPEGIWLSDSGIFNQFTEGGADNQAIFTRATGAEINTVQWVASAHEVLLIGTFSGEGKVISTDDSILTQDSARFVALSKRGSIHRQPVFVDKDPIFIQRDGKTLRRVRSTLEEDDVAEDITVLSEHIVKQGINQLSYMQSPDSIVWAERNDGAMVGYTLEKQQQVVAAHKHIAGGVHDILGNQARIVSMATMPHPSATADQAWLCVERLINGSLVKYVEFLEDKFDPAFGDDPTLEDLILAIQGQAWFLDAAAEVNVPLTITDISEASPGVVTSASHGISEGTRVRITEVSGLLSDPDDPNSSLVNFREFLATNVATNTFELYELDGVTPWDTAPAGATAYVAGGVVREMFTTITGLNHLEGETVTILADGAERPAEVVASNQVTLDDPASQVVIGLGYISEIETMRLVSGTGSGGSQAQPTRVPQVGLRLFNTTGDLEIAIGPDIDTNLGDNAGWQTISFREDEWIMNTPPPLFTGDKTEPVDGGWRRGRTVRARQVAPLPAEILALYPRAEANEK